MKKLLLFIIPFLLLVSCQNHEEYDNEEYEERAYAGEHPDNLVNNDNHHEEEHNDDDDDDHHEEYENDRNYQTKPISKYLVRQAFIKQRLGGNYSACNISNILIGDLNGDGVNDGLVRYSCSVVNGNNLAGNAAMPTAWAAFINYDGDLQLAVNDWDTRGIVPKYIRNGLVYSEQYKHDTNDPRCCPSLVYLLKIRLSGNRFSVISREGPILRGVR